MTSALAEHRAGPELGDRLTVDLDRDHAVEDQEQLVAHVALLHERLVRRDLLDPRLRAPRMICIES